MFAIESTFSNAYDVMSLPDSDRRLLHRGGGVPADGRASCCVKSARWRGL